MSSDGKVMQNPVLDTILGDPFVLLHEGRYYAYGTSESTNYVPAFYSDDLVEWTSAGSVLREIGEGLCYWAPEVAFENGIFYMYFSAGGPEGEGHRLRVATADSPLGPFVDCGVVLDETEPFNIDAHPFRDDDGQWYLYYSQDFLDGDYPGTGIVVDRLVDMTKLAGEKRVVVRPHAQWHIYEKDRHWYDRHWNGWYTIEGATVRKVDGIYWCFYSGGAWREENYGISVVSSSSPMGEFTAPPGTNPEDGPTISRSVPGKVIGPGHASITVAPDGVTDYLVYHAWDVAHTGRYMNLAPLRWVDGRPQAITPSVDPQPMPPR